MSTLAPALLFLALSLTLLCRPVTAQVGAIESDPAQGIGSLAGARNTVAGQVSLPNGRRLERRAKVRIAGATGGTLFTFTDDNGGFAFRRLAPGTYFLTVDAGPEFQTATETVDIFGPGIGRGATQTVYVQLRFKEAAAAKPGTVSAELAGVPKAALELYEKAARAAREGRGEKAVEALRRAVEIHPRFMLAYNELGVQYMRVNRPDEAAQALRTAIEIAPDAAAPRLNYGILLFHRNSLAEAEQHLRHSLLKKEGTALAHLYLGRALIRRRDYGGAEKEMLRAAELGGPEVNEAYRFLGGIYRETGDHARAVEALEKYLALEPKAKDAGAIRDIIGQLRKQAAAARR